MKSARVQCRLRGEMICPECKAEYRQGFTRCADCDVDLVATYADVARHPLEKKASAVPDKYREQLWRGTDPHFYVELLWSLWNKSVACYGVPENPAIPETMRGPHLGTWEPSGFEVWVSEENLPLAKWILDSASEELKEDLPEDRFGKGRHVFYELSPGTTGVCPLCFGEFTTAYSDCPNCGVALRSPELDMTMEDTARTLCNLAHPKFIIELRAALLAEGIPFNNANFSSGDIVSGRHYVPNYVVSVLTEGFERATQVMSQVLQQWEFEPSAGFGIAGDPLQDYWPVRADENGWFREDISTLVWSGQNIGLLGPIGMALQENQIPYRVETEPLGTARVLSHPEDEERARELVRDIVDGPRPE